MLTYAFISPDEAVVAESVAILALLPKDSASKWRIHVLKAATVSNKPSCTAWMLARGCGRDMSAVLTS